MITLQWPLALVLVPWSLMAEDLMPTDCVIWAKAMDGIWPTGHGGSAMAQHSTAMTSWPNPCQRLGLVDTTSLGIQSSANEGLGEKKTVS